MPTFSSFLSQYLRYGVDCYFVSLPVHLLNGGIIRVFMTHEKSGFDIAAVRISSLPVEYFLVQFNVVIVNGIVECNHYHLRDLSRGDISRYCSPIFRTVTIRETAFL